MIWTRAERLKIAKEMGLNPREFAQRRTGKSTELAFYYFYSAYKKRGSWVGICDHFGTRAANKFLFNTMQLMAEQLGFTFEWNVQKLAIRLKND